MTAVPTAQELSLIYAPLTLFLVVAIVGEIRTTRIPNVLTFLMAGYFLTARALIGPQPINVYLTSVTIVSVTLIMTLYVPRYLAAGGVKFAIAISPVLLPWMAVGVCILTTAFVGIQLHLDKLAAEKSETAEPRLWYGSVVISGATAAIMLVALLETNFHFLSTYVALN